MTRSPLWVRQVRGGQPTTAHCVSVLDYVTFPNNRMNDGGTESLCRREIRGTVHTAPKRDHLPDDWPACMDCAREVGIIPALPVKMKARGRRYNSRAT